MKNRKKASLSRRRLLDTARRLLSRAQDLATERHPLLKGAFQLRGTRCGKDNCKCTQGELHTTAVLVVSEDGRRRSYYLRGAERPEVQRRVERYQRFRTKRAEINRLSTEVLETADDLLESLAERHSPQRDARTARRPSKSRKEPHSTEESER